MILNMDLAKDEIYKKNKNAVVVSGVDYDTVYVFSVIPKGTPEGALLANDLISVDKKTGVVLGFNPMEHNPANFFATVKDNLVEFDTREGG